LVTLTTEGKIATRADAEKVDADPPLDQLMRLQQSDKKPVEKGESVVYWMRMEDMRSE
jgi:deoxyribodipyrimidine photo-lyase